MNLDQLLSVIEYLKDNTNYHLPHSSNRPSVKNQPFHRRFWVHAMRARKDKDGLREKIREWGLNLEEDTVDENFKYRKVKFSLFDPKKNEYSLQEIDEDFLLKLPRRTNKKRHKDGTPFTPQEKAEANAKNAIKFGVGNCSEHSSHNFCCLLEYPRDGFVGQYPDGEIITFPPITEDILVERIRILDDSLDHEFVLVGRDPNSDLKDPTKWGNKTIIFDTWWSDTIAVVAECLKNPDQALGSFNYINKGKDSIECTASGYMGQGHTKRWIEKRKNESIYLIEKPAFFADRTENVPWVTEPPRKKLKI